jgi:tRNA-2-methylthio-N6-dimethylallyladenosine synthase
VIEADGDSSSNDRQNLSPLDHESKSVAFVPIVEGCNKFCSYCIVPFSRGREVSKPASEIVAEIEALKAAGFCEVQLIGQNVNSYRPQTTDGIEHLSGATPFVKLLKAVAQTNIKRIKYTTSFPRDFHTEIIETMCEYTNLCNWVHLPVQSGSDSVLKRMRRGYTSKDYMGKVAALKSAKRSIALTTDIIVGFPGETDNDFMRTVELVKESRFHSIYIFNYSQRAGTYASRLTDDVPLEEKKRRFLFLQGVQQQIQSDIYESYVDSTQSVLVTGRSSRSVKDAVGHSTCNKVVNFAAPPEMNNQIVDVRITQAKHNSLYGEIKFNAAEKSV